MLLLSSLFMTPHLQYTHTQTYTHAYICKHTQKTDTNTQRHSHTDRHTHTHSTDTNTQMHMHVCTHREKCMIHTHQHAYADTIWKHPCMYPCIHTDKYTYACTHTHTHTSTDTNTDTQTVIVKAQTITPHSSKGNKTIKPRAEEVLDLIS